MLRHSGKAERKLFVSAIYIFDYKIYVFRKNVRDYVIFFFYHISPRLPAKFDYLRYLDFLVIFGVLVIKYRYPVGFSDAIGHLIYTNLFFSSLASPQPVSRDTCLILRILQGSLIILFHFQQN